MSRGSILIAEDEAIVAADLASKLEHLGYRVSASVRRGDEAVAVVRSAPPDLVIMDIRLQGEVDGVDAAAAIRSRQALPVIYLTAHSDASTLARAKLTEPFGYILKPFRERELEIAIEIALYKHQVEKSLCAAREQLAKANLELESKVQERTTKLRETMADLEQFSYSIAHDLRAPLRAMSSFSSILLEEADHHYAPEALDYLRRIAAAAKRMDCLIRDVLDYSRVVRAEVSLLTTDLEHVIQEMFEHYPRLEEHRASITIVRPLLPVFGNPVLLLQCISNILDNAVNFVGAGVRPRISVWTKEQSGRVRFCVQDNGIGIDPAQIDRIWRLFERGQRQTEYAGTGIGLSLVKRAVERMGGTVGVESTLGAGSLFWFELSKPQS